MTLRRIERLLRDARYSANVQDIDALSDEIMLYYANRTQSMIEDRLFKINSMNNLFMDEQEITIVDGQIEYDLNFDVYALNSIKSVGIRRDASVGYIIEPLDFISEKESGMRLGYYLREGKIGLNFQKTSNGPVVIKYNRKIPSLWKRFGAAITSSGVGTVTVGATTDDILTFDDFFCTVDADGAIQSRNNRISTYNTATGVLTFTAGTGTIANGEYVVVGKYATTHSQLPQECEKVFLEILERRIAQRQSQADIAVISGLTEAEIQSIEDVFAKGNDDNEVPPTPNYSEFI